MLKKPSNEEVFSISEDEEENKERKQSEDQPESRKESGFHKKSTRELHAGK